MWPSHRSGASGGCIVRASDLILFVAPPFRFGTFSFPALELRISRKLRLGTLLNVAGLGVRNATLTYLIQHASVVLPPAPPTYRTRPRFFFSEALRLFFLQHKLL